MLFSGRTQRRFIFVFSYAEPTNFSCKNLLKLRKHKTGATRVTIGLGKNIYCP